MRDIMLILMLVFAVLIPDSAKAASSEDMMHVRLVNYIGNTSKVSFQLKGDYFTFDPTIELKEGVTYQLVAKKGSLFLREGKETYRIQESLVLIPNNYDYQHVIQINDRPYLGAVELRLEDKEFIRPVNQLPLEDYLKGVVPFEVFPDWGLETLKAQALAARTYAASHLDQEIDDTISYQVYGGYTWNENTTKAVEETKGEVITYDNQLIDAFYSASNGGVTENNSHVWGGKALPFFPIKDDPYDPTHPWEFTLNKVQVDVDNMDWYNPDWWGSTKEKDKEITSSIKKWLNNHGYPGEIKILSIPKFELTDQQLASDRSVRGSISVEFLWKLFEGTVLYQRINLDDVKLNRIRPMIGGTIFKSYLIDSLENEDEAYTMKGKGYGHGVGMSQWGAYVMGEKGKNYKEIIQFYFPKTDISQIK
ncbi:SpoIID/LytB domain-containing protein [Oceanobacillus halophilus]|uniref:SpoIID/LytB domain-containing protein n=1 Tax=Oceanobacillus halophilus TaxID=930130 RepID=A0A494ZW27_9BACI|nr:SpoIID/LytB domain-containing protein [Oceanobacillus halophilus]RKQ30775.1 SpoIID/LytB domain-containing protein [Oceanobacillus halophilus]